MKKLLILILFLFCGINLYAEFFTDSTYTQRGKFAVLKADQANISSTTISGKITLSDGTIITSTSTLGGGGGSGDVVLASTQTFTGQNSFNNLVTISSAIRFGDGTQLSTYSSGDVVLSATQTFTGSNTFSQNITASSITFTTQGIITNSTSTFSQNSDLLDGQTGSYYATSTDLTNLQISTGSLQPLDADLTDLADGSLTGSKVGSGVPAANIANGSLGSGVICSSIAINAVQINNINATGESGYLNKDGTWSAPAGSGDVVLASTQTFTGQNTFKNAIFTSSSIVNVTQIVWGDGTIQVTSPTAGSSGGDADTLDTLDSTAFYQLDSSQTITGYNTYNGINHFYSNLIIGSNTVTNVLPTINGGLNDTARLYFKRSSAGTNTGLGHIYFNGLDSADNDTSMSYIRGFTLSPTDGAEEGGIDFINTSTGSFTTVMRIISDKVGIGTTAPGTSLDVVGAITTSSSVIFSDQTKIQGARSVMALTCYNVAVNTTTFIYHAPYNFIIDTVTVRIEGGDLYNFNFEVNDSTGGFERNMNATDFSLTVASGVVVISSFTNNTLAYNERLFLRHKTVTGTVFGVYMSIWKRQNY